MPRMRFPASLWCLAWSTFVLLSGCGYLMEKVTTATLPSGAQLVVTSLGNPETVSILASSSVALVWVGPAADGASYVVSKYSGTQCAGSPVEVRQTSEQQSTFSGLATGDVVSFSVVVELGGSRGAAVCSQSYRIDLAPPTITVTSPTSPAVSAGSTVSVSWTSSDVGPAGLATTPYIAKLFSNGTCTGTEIATETLGVPAWTTSSLGNGTYSVGITSRDTVGNQSVLVCSPEIQIAVAPEANLILGHADFSVNLNVTRGMSGPEALTVVGTRLFVAESGTGRAFAYNTIPTVSGTIPDFAVGVPNLNIRTANWPSISESTLNGPRGIHAAGGKLAVGDCGNNRVLIWNSIPTSFGTPADVVLGQPDFTSSAANAGGSVSAQTLSCPRSVFIDSVGNRLFVADRSNNRVLVWSPIPTTSFSPAAYALGQTGLTTATANSPSRTAATMNAPDSVLLVGSALFVSDTSNHRLLRWNSLSGSSGQPADVVLGQSNATSATANSGGLSATSLNLPGYLSSDGTKLVLTDRGNHRVKIWNSVPSSNVAADVVFGQPNFTSNSTTLSDASLQNPGQALIIGTQLAIADNANNRVLIFNSIPASGTGGSASVVLGQDRFDQNATWSSFVTNRTFNRPRGACLGGGKFIVPDYINHRVLVFNSEPTSNFAPADLVLSQADFLSNLANAGTTVTASNVQQPIACWTDGVRLAVSDFGNSRILIWNTFPTVNNQPADVVLGQLNKTTGGQNNPSRSASSLHWPGNIAVSGSHFIVAETINGTPANVVLGQQSMTTAISGTAAGEMSLPTGLAVHGTRLYVAEHNNNRVVYWNAIPTTDGTSPDGVIGQGTTSGSAFNFGGYGSKGLVNPFHLISTTNHLWVVDHNNHRVIRFPHPM